MLGLAEVLTSIPPFNVKELVLKPTLISKFTLHS